DGVGQDEQRHAPQSAVLSDVGGVRPPEPGFHVETGPEADASHNCRQGRHDSGKDSSDGFHGQSSAASQARSSSRLGPACTSRGPCPLRKILAPAPDSVTCPSSTRSTPFSHSPTTGVSFISWNSRRRSSRVSPKCLRYQKRCQTYVDPVR